MSIKHKRKSTSGYTWTSSDLADGQIGVNTADGTLHLKKTDLSIATIGGSGSGSGGGGGGGSTTLAGLSDVNLPFAMAGATLVYNSTSGKWEGSSILNALPPASDGSVLVYNGGAGTWMTVNTGWLYYVLWGAMSTPTNGQTLIFNSSAGTAGSFLAGNTSIAHSADYIDIFSGSSVPSGYALVSNGSGGWYAAPAGGSVTLLSDYIDVYSGAGVPSGNVLTSNGAGGWYAAAPATTVISAGTYGTIQLSDGAGGFTGSVLGTTGPTSLAPTTPVSYAINGYSNYSSTTGYQMQIVGGLNAFAAGNGGGATLAGGATTSTSSGGTGGSVVIRGGSATGVGNLTGVGGQVTLQGGRNTNAGSTAAQQGTLAFKTYNLQRLLITGTGAFSFGTTATNFGTAGQVLTSTGDGVPTWGGIQAPTAVLASLPSASTVGALLVVTDANSSAGALCFANGTNWIDSGSHAVVA